MLNFFQDKKNEGLKSKYGVQDFIFRLKKIEKCLVKEKLDAILIVTGIDSQENNTYTKLINWLFLGYSGVEVLENDFLGTAFQNLIILIKQEKVYIYSSREGLEEIKHLVYAIPNVEVFVPSEEEQQNENECENLKLSQFFKIMTGIKRVGVALGTKDKGVVKRIEKWPLIQGYGLSEFERGFFTMNHEVVDISRRVNANLKSHDKYSLSQLLQGNSKRLAGHFNAAADVISDTKFHKRQLITEQSLNDILIDSYELEQLSKHIIEDQNLPKPRVLFGERTNLPFTSTSQDIMIKQCRIDESAPCIQATFESVDLHSHIRAARTYFLKKNVRFEPHLIPINDDFDVVQNYDLKIEENPSFNDEEMLVNLYANLVISFQEVMAQISNDYTQLNPEFIRNHVHQKLQKVIQSSCEHFNVAKESVLVDLIQYDAVGNQGQIDLKETITFKLTPVIYVLRLQLKDIPSIQFEKKSLGSIIFAESFIFQEGSYLPLTKDIPYLKVFNTDNTYSQGIQDMKKRIEYEPLGGQINEWDPKENQYKLYTHSRMFFPAEKLTHFGLDIPITICSYIFHQNGLRMQSPQLGWFFLFFKDIKNPRFTTGLKTSWMIFQLENNFVLNAMNRKQCCIEFVNEQVEQVMFKIKEFFEQNEMEYGYIEGTQIPVFQESNLGAKQILDIKETRLMKLNQILDQQYLLNYLQAKQLMIQNVQKDLKLKSFQSLSDLKDDKIQPNPAKVQLLFVNGASNSGKRKFAANLIKHGQPNGFKLILLDFNYYQSKYVHLDAKGYVNSIIATSRNNQAIGGNILVCPIPHWINSQKVVEYFIKNEKLSNIFEVRGVLSKINVSNFIQNDHLSIVPQVLTYAVTGFSQAIIFDTYDNYEEDVKNIERIVKEVLPDQKFYRIMGNVVQMGLGKELLQFSYYQNDYNGFNRQRFSVFYNFPEKYQQYQEVFIPFKLPLDKQKMYQVLHKDLFKKKQGYLWKDSELENKISTIKEYYKDSNDELADQIVSIKEKIEITKLENQSCNIEYVKALVRFDNNLSDGVYELTVNQNYLIQKKLKNISVTVDKKHKIIEPKSEKEIQVQRAVYKQDDFKNSSALPDQQNTELGYLFAGYNLNAEKITEFLNTLWRDQPEQESLQSKAELNQEQIKEIEVQNRNYPTDNGEFFDGYLFRDEDGLPLKAHPKLEQILDEHFSEKNQKIKEENEKLMDQYNIAKQFYREMFYE